MMRCGPLVALCSALALTLGVCTNAEVPDDGFFTADTELGALVFKVGGKVSASTSHTPALCCCTAHPRSIAACEPHHVHPPTHPHRTTVTRAFFLPPRQTLQRINLPITCSKIVVETGMNLGGNEFLLVPDRTIGERATWTNGQSYMFFIPPGD